MAQRAMLLILAVITIGFVSPAFGNDATIHARISVRVLDTTGVGVKGLPIVADRQRITRASTKPCGWTNEDGFVTLDILAKSDSDANSIRVPIRIATVTPGCATNTAAEIQAEKEWTHHVDALMNTNAFPDSVDAIVIPQEPLQNEAAAQDESVSNVSVTMRATRAVRVLARVKHLKDRVLFCTPERISAFNPMWELFRLAERVPTDEVIMDGVPMFDNETPTLIRLVSSGKIVSCIVEVPLATRRTAVYDDGTREVVDLGSITLPQDIAKYPIDEAVSILAKDGTTKRLELGRAISLTLCAVDGTHQGLLWHIDVMGGASGSPKTGNFDQRAHMPTGTFAIASTKLLDSPLAFAKFLQAAQSADWKQFDFQLIKVEAGKASTLEFDEQRGLTAITKVLEMSHSDNSRHESKAATPGPK